MIAFELAWSGSEKTRAGTKTRAGGKVTTETGRKAVADTMDAGLALLKNGNAGDDKPKREPKEPKPKDAKSEEAKKLQKEIKASFVFHYYFCEIALNLKPSESEIANLDHLDMPRLRDKSGKAREVAMELGRLGVPHQDARAL